MSQSHDKAVNILLNIGQGVEVLRDEFLSFRVSGSIGSKAVVGTNTS